jgi:hypothetical protein
MSFILAVRCFGGDVVWGKCHSCGNGKFQIPNPKQIPSTKFQTKKAIPSRGRLFPFGAWDLVLVWNLGFGIWDFRRLRGGACLFGIWDLEFGISAGLAAVTLAV